MKASLLTVASLFTAAVSVGAFSVDSCSDRRSFLGGITAASLGVLGTSTSFPSGASAGDFRLGDPKSVVGREIRSFNALINEFKNTALDGGLDASKIEGPSIPFIDFGENMKAENVKEVEFMAPNGEVAYVTLKKSNKKFPAGTPIRIGQGYPTGGRNSWSSPDYVIRSVSNFRVPYKFTVPALAKYKK